MTESLASVFFQKTSASKVLGARIIKLRQKNLFDIEFSTGEVKSYVENISEISFNSGEYVSVVFFKNAEELVFKIMGRGKAFNLRKNIPIIKV